jgi:hypothetical protein
MKVEIREYLPEDIVEIMDHNPRDRDVYFSKHPDWAKWAVRWKEEGPSYTLVIDDQIVGCAGVIIPKEGFGEAWMVLSSLFYKYKKECFKAVQNKLDQIIRKWKLRRVQALVMTDFPEAEHWLRHLGLKNETPEGMKRFGPSGEDMYLYAMVIK